MSLSSLQELILAYQHWRLAIAVHGLAAREPGDPELTPTERREYVATIHALDATHDQLNDALDHFMELMINPQDARQHD